MLSSDSANTHYFKYPIVNFSSEIFFTIKNTENKYVVVRNLFGQITLNKLS